MKKNKWQLPSPIPNLLTEEGELTYRSNRKVIPSAYKSSISRHADSHLLNIRLQIIQIQVIAFFFFFFFFCLQGISFNRATRDSKLR